MATYLVNQFFEVSETDCGFRNPIQEDKVRDDEFKPGPGSVQEDRSLGEASLPLTIEWIKKQIREGTLPSGGLDKKSLSFALDPNPPTSEEVELDRIKNQVHIRGQDQLKTTFTTEWGTFAFNRMPFGLCNAPGTFQRLMMDIFQDFLRHFLEVFINDFAVFSSRNDHLGYLRKTFQRCRETSLKLHPGKCFFGMTSGVLLGHVVSSKGLEVDLGKVKIILTLVTPKSVRDIRGFLGCVGYYRRFIDGYARKAIPLTELLRKEVEFNWNPERQKAFEDLKLALSKAPILSPPDWEREFHVTLDASGWCLGAILWQYDAKRRECPIYYASRQMSQAETRYSTTEREALAVIYACKKFRHYLLGYRIVFHTAHDSLKYLVNKPDLSGRIARWILLLQEFTYEVVVKSGKTNANADFLSRQRGTPAVESLNADFPDEFQDNQFPESVFHVEGEDVSEFHEIITYLTERKYPEGLNREEKSVFQSKVAPYSIIQGILFKMGADDTLRRCLEKKDRKRVMTALHSESSGGHFAAITTVNQIRSAGILVASLNPRCKKACGGL